MKDEEKDEKSLEEYLEELQIISTTFTTSNSGGVSITSGVSTTGNITVNPSNSNLINQQLLQQPFHSQLNPMNSAPPHFTYDVRSQDTERLQNIEKLLLLVMKDLIATRREVAELTRLVEGNPKKRVTKTK